MKQIGCLMLVTVFSIAGYGCDRTAKSNQAAQPSRQIEKSLGGLSVKKEDAGEASASASKSKSKSVTPQKPRVITTSEVEKKPCRSVPCWKVPPTGLTTDQCYFMERGRDNCAYESCARYGPVPLTYGKGCRAPYVELCGQDAQYPDRRIAGKRYTLRDNGQEIVDNDTGLIWQKSYVHVEKSEGCVDSKNVFCRTTQSSWLEAANDYCETLNLADNTEWRLPISTELSSLVDYSQIEPTTHFPGDFPDGGDWFLSFQSRDNKKGTYGSFTFGEVFDDSQRTGYGRRDNVRCVRGGVDRFFEENEQRFVKRKKDKATILDRGTGLKWQEFSSPTPMKWPDALRYCETGHNQEFGGRHNWRLPNINELRSLVSYTPQEGTKPKTLIENMKAGKYWSSTQSIRTCEDAWVVDFSNGDSGHVYKGGDYEVRCVSGVSQ